MAKLVYARRGNKIVKKYRCTTGKRKGKLVSSPQGCFGPLDLKKKMRMRRLRKQKERSIALKTKRTKMTNPVSKQVARLNKLRDK
jgi:hypothetical protein